MTNDEKSTVEQIVTSRPILWAFCVLGLILVMVSAVRFQAPHLLGAEKVLTDFDAFYIAGTMAADGQVAGAYHANTLFKVQEEISGAQSFMPWTYPPPFTLAMEAFAALPIGVAYIIFTLGSFAFYLLILHRIAGARLPGVLMGIMPVVLLNLRTGQNGFLIAALCGALLINWQRRPAIAGIPLGLMVIKPHLAVGVGLMTLIGRRWLTLTIAALVALTALGVSTLAYGWEIWSYFFGAVKEAGQFLSLGYYPLYRMNSLFAAFFTLGVTSQIALAAQTLGAIVSIGTIVWACLAYLDFRHRAAVICGMTLFVSPYGYDYDMTILGVALAFIMPDLIERCSRQELTGLLLQTWLTCGYGIIFQTIRDFSGASEHFTQFGDSKLSLIGPAVIVLYARVAFLLARKSTAVMGVQASRIQGA